MKLKQKYLLTIVIITGIISIIAISIIIFELFLKERINNFGKLPLCNLNEKSALKINGFVLPLCYRCTFIILGATIGGIISLIFSFKLNKWTLFVLISLILICFLDGILQYGFNIESNNIKRAFTGFFAGLSLVILIIDLFNKKIFS